MYSLMAFDSFMSLFLFVFVPAGSASTFDEHQRENNVAYATGEQNGNEKEEPDGEDIRNRRASNHRSSDVKKRGPGADEHMEGMREPRL